MIARRLTVTGRVQGVFFRDWTVAEARALGLTGWVRNRTDGSVEAVVQGDPDAVAAMIARLHRGPSASRVASVAAAEVEPDPALAGFARQAGG